jgi:hypothetical protein
MSENDIDLEALSTDTHGYTVDDEDDDEPVLLDREGRPVETWRERYPYDERMSEHLNPRGARVVALEKPWFSVSPAEQRTRFAIRLVDPVRQWKFSPMDMESIDKWEEYTAAKEDMFRMTDTDIAPWIVVKSNDKKRARLNAMRHLLGKFDYDDKDHEVVGEADPLIVGRALSD